MAVHGLIVRALGGGTSTGSIALLITRGLIGTAAAAAVVVSRYFVQIVHLKRSRRK